MEGTDFREGERLWLRGQPVTFVSYNRYSSSKHTAAAFVRKDGESSSRVVNAARLGRSPTESIARETAIPAI